MKIITIGRDPEKSDIVINDNFVGRTHLQLVLDDSGNYRLTDLNSKNGTYVNGKRINGEVLLNQYDIIRIGNTTLPWRNYIENSSDTGTIDTSSNIKSKWWKNIKWRNILSVVGTIVSLLFTIMMLLRLLK